MQTSYLTSNTKHLKCKIPTDVPLLNAAPRTKAICVKECMHTSPQLINIGSRWRWVAASDTVERLLHLRRKIAREPSNRRLYGPQWRSLHIREQKNYFSAPGIESYFVHHLTCVLVIFT